MQPLVLWRVTLPSDGVGASILRFSVWLMMQGGALSRVPPLEYWQICKTKCDLYRKDRTIGKVEMSIRRHHVEEQDILQATHASVQMPTGVIVLPLAHR